MRRIDVLRAHRGCVRRRARRAGAPPAGRGGARARARAAAAWRARRLRAGIASPAEEIRAGVAVDVAEVEREHTEHELATARQMLAASWSGEEARFERAEGDLEQLPASPSEDELASRLEASPLVARWQAELAQRDARRERARSERIPDVTLHAGPRRLSGPDDTALVVGALGAAAALGSQAAARSPRREQRVAKVGAEARAARVRAVTELDDGAHRPGRVVGGGAPAARRACFPAPSARSTRCGAATSRAASRRSRCSTPSAHASARASSTCARSPRRTTARSEIERLTGVPLEVRP